MTIYVPWGKDGELIPQNIKAGDVLNVTNGNDVYGIAKEEFEETYKLVANENTKEKQESVAKEKERIEALVLSSVEVKSRTQKELTDAYIASTPQYDEMSVIDKAKSKKQVLDIVQEMISNSKIRISGDGKKVIPMVRNIEIDNKKSHSNTKEI